MCVRAFRKNWSASCRMVLSGYMLPFLFVLLPRRELFLFLSQSPIWLQVHQVGLWAAEFLEQKRGLVSFLIYFSRPILILYYQHNQSKQVRKSKRCCRWMRKGASDSHHRSILLPSWWEHLNLSKHSGEFFPWPHRSETSQLIINVLVTMTCSLSEVLLRRCEKCREPWPASVPFTYFTIL